MASWSVSPSFRRMMAPLPNSFSTPAMATSRALLRFLSSMGRRLFLPILRTRSARRSLGEGRSFFFPPSRPWPAAKRSRRRSRPSPRCLPGFFRARRRELRRSAARAPRRARTARRRSRGRSRHESGDAERRPQGGHRVVHQCRRLCTREEDRQSAPRRRHRRPWLRHVDPRRVPHARRLEEQEHPALQANRLVGFAGEVREFERSHRIAGDPSLCPVASTGGRLKKRVTRCAWPARTATSASARRRSHPIARSAGRSCSDAPPNAARARRAYGRSSGTRPDRETGASSPRSGAASRGDRSREKGAANVEVSSRSGSPPAGSAFDLDEVAAAGAVVRASGDKVRLSLGSPRSVAWLTPDAPSATPRVFVEVVVPLPGTAPAAKKGAPAAPRGAPSRRSDLRLDLLVPKVALLSSVTAEGSSVELQQLALEPGAPIGFRSRARSATPRGPSG